ncbi:MAG: hypothetical protein JSS46_12980 [Proteobacteria bacterium]|jgi:hypothetical protein|nr:hypothetical protein [Pseudomonadota bacterium]
MKARADMESADPADNLSALIHEPSFKQAAGEAVFSKAPVADVPGNARVGHRPQASLHFWSGTP